MQKQWAHGWVSVTPDHEVTLKNRAFIYLLYYYCFCSVDKNHHLHPVDVNVFMLISTVRTVSEFLQRVVNRHTIIVPQGASSSSEPLDTLFVCIRIIMIGILPGFISSTIRKSWAIIAPPKAITVVSKLFSGFGDFAPNCYPVSNEMSRAAVVACLSSESKSID